MTKVKIVPKTARMKNRVKQHGDIMRVVDNPLATQHKVLVESLQASWGPMDNRMHWWCWVTPADADLIPVKESA